MLYLFFKWVHILSIISWMAGILYLIRIFVNHRENGFENAAVHSLLLGMGTRIYRIITLPAMIASWICGLAMLHLMPTLILTHWLKLKIFAVILLTLVTLRSGQYVGRFEKKDDTLPSGKQLRFLNEVPTLLMMLIVGLVVFRPF